MIGYGVELLEDRVDAVDSDFSVRLASGDVLKARRILVATGIRDELPEITGVRERWGRDLLHCPYCHGWEVRDQQIGVLGTVPAQSSTPNFCGSGPMTSPFSHIPIDLTATNTCNSRRVELIVSRHVRGSSSKKIDWAALSSLMAERIARTALSIRPLNVCGTRMAYSRPGCAWATTALHRRWLRPDEYRSVFGPPATSWIRALR